MLKGKKIVLGITGSIAAYKACLIIRGLIKAGAEVQVVITPAGKEFITPITLSALTQKPVISDLFVAFTCRSWLVGGCDAHSSMYSFYAGQDGQRHS